MLPERLRNSAVDGRVAAIRHLAGRRDPEAAIRKLCGQLRARTRQNEPPFDVHKYAAARGAAVVEDGGLPTHGVLTREGPGLLIRVDASLPLVRRRFVCCHELVHTFFEEAASRYYLRARGRNGFTQEEERLCNLGAAELLVPERILRPMLAGRTLSTDLLRAIGRAFEVSLLVASRRVVACADQPVAVVHWTSIEGAGRNQLRPAGFFRGIPRSVLHLQGGAAECVATSRRTVFETPWPGSDSRRIICESIPLAGRAPGPRDEGRATALSLLYTVT